MENGIAFSRNATESFANEQPINIENPEELLMLALYLANPDVDNLRRGLNVKVDMRRSRKEGRYLGATPKGYNSLRDNIDKPILVPNKDSKHIEKAFELICTGKLSQRGVIKLLKEEGCIITRTRMSAILKNPIYKGYVFVPGYKDESEQLINGIHEPIVSEFLVEKTQDIISGRRPKMSPYKTKSLSKFPIRGLIECEKCGNKLAANSSKGNGGMYEYYHCTNGCDKRFSAGKLEFEISKILQGLQLKPEEKELYVKMLELEITGDLRRNLEEKKRLTAIVKKLDKKLMKLNNLLLEGTLDSIDYKKIKSQNKLEKLEAEDALAKINDVKRQDFVKQLKSAFGLIEKLPEYYKKGSIETKRQIIGSMFPQKFIFKNNEVRTNKINETFLLLCKNSKGLKRIKKRDKLEKSNLSRNVP